MSVQSRFTEELDRWKRIVSKFLGVITDHVLFAKILHCETFRTEAIERCVVPCAVSMLCEFYNTFRMYRI